MSIFKMFFVQYQFYMRIRSVLNLRIHTKPILNEEQFYDACWTKGIFEMYTKMIAEQRCFQATDKIDSEPMSFSKCVQIKDIFRLQRKAKEHEVCVTENYYGLQTVNRLWLQTSENEAGGRHLWQGDVSVLTSRFVARTQCVCVWSTVGLVYSVLWTERELWTTVF